MKAKQIITLMVLPLLLDVLIVSCCECDPPASFSYTNCSISVQNIDNAGPQPVISESGGIPKKAYGIRIEILRKENICLNDAPQLFSTTAFATSCYCPPDLYRPQDSIVSINISTVNNFDSLHFAGGDISEYFRVSGFTTIKEFVANTKALLRHDLDSTFNFDVLLITPPDNPGPHEFKVQVLLSDGRILEKSTPIIQLK